MEAITITAENYKSLTFLMERIVHKYNQIEQIKRSYGEDAILTRSEIHTIAAIGENKDLNVTTLAKIMGITKGAASQMVYKLVDKGLVTKKTSPVSDTEVVLGLTERGMTACENHRRYHATAHERFFSMLKNLPDETGLEFEHLLTEFDKALDEHMDGKL